MGSAWHRSIRRTDGQVDVRLSRLSIHRLGLCRTKNPPLRDFQTPNRQHNQDTRGRRNPGFSEEAH